MTETRATFADALANPVYRVVFGTRAIAIAGDTLRIFALSVLVFHATGSTLAASLAFGLGFLPQSIGGVLLGALPDLVRPRVLIVSGYFAECAGAVAIALLPLPIWASLLIVAVIACLAPVFHGTSGRVIADVLTGDAYVVGRSLFFMAAALAQLAGLAVGALAVAAIGSVNALLFSAGAHLVAAVTSWLLLPNMPAAGRTGTGSTVRQSWRGNSQLLRDPVVRALLLVQWLPLAFVSGAESLLVPYADRNGHPPGSAGLLLACVPVGMIVGNLVTTRLRPALRERLTAWLIALLGTPLLIFVLALAPVPAAVLLFASACGLSYTLGLQRRYVEAVPDDLRGQGFTLMSTGIMTLQGLGPIVFGALGEFLPAGPVIALAGAATLITALALRGSEIKAGRLIR